MPRQLRIEYPGAMYHLMSRGNRREDIFLDDEKKLLTQGPVTPVFLAPKPRPLHVGPARLPLYPKLDFTELVSTSTVSNKNRARKNPPVLPAP